MSLYTETGKALRLGEELGSGAEGTVFRLLDTSDICIKVYSTDKPDVERRLAALRGLPPREWRGDHSEHVHVAWPLATVYQGTNGRRETVGFLMPLVEGVPLTRLFDPSQRARALDQPTWRTLCSIGARIARLFDRLHDVGVIVGDTSPSNVLVSRTGHVTLIDCDATQFRDPTNREVHHATKVTADYAPPQILGGGTGNVTQVLDPTHDYFGLAVMITQLLMEGQHPYEGVPVDGDQNAVLPDNIRAGRNRVSRPTSLRAPANLGLLSVDILPPDVRRLAEGQFEASTVGGRRLHETRTTHREWARALDAAGFQVMGCRVNPLHFRHQSLAECPWCERLAAGFGEAFPPAVPAPATTAHKARVPRATSTGTSATTSAGGTRSANGGTTATPQQGAAAASGRPQQTPRQTPRQTPAPTPQTGPTVPPTVPPSATPPLTGVGGQTGQGRGQPAQSGSNNQPSSTETGPIATVLGWVVAIVVWAFIVFVALGILAACVSAVTK